MSGTSQGDAAGFELSFLTKLVEIKSNQPRLNMLHMIVKDIPNEQVLFSISCFPIQYGNRLISVIYFFKIKRNYFD